MWYILGYDNISLLYQSFINQTFLGFGHLQSNLFRANFFQSLTLNTIHLVFGLPGLRFPSGFVCISFRGTSFSSILCTWRSHLSRLLMNLTISGSLRNCYYRWLNLLLLPQLPSSTTPPKMDRRILLLLTAKSSLRIVVSCTKLPSHMLQLVELTICTINI